MDQHRLKVPYHASTARNLRHGGWRCRDDMDAYVSCNTAIHTECEKQCVQGPVSRREGAEEGCMYLDVYFDSLCWTIERLTLKIWVMLLKLVLWLGLNNGH